MATRAFFSILQKDTFVSVAGYQLSIHFACRMETGKGYRITHLPTGWLLCDMGFTTVDLAKKFADLIEEGLGDKVLGDMNVRVLEKAAKSSPKFALYHQLIQELNTLSKTKPTVTDGDLNVLVEKILDGQEAGKNS